MQILNMKLAKRTVVAFVVLVAVIVTTFVTPLANAQGQTGVTPFSSFAGGVNLGNLNSAFSAPLYHKNGRGLGIDLALLGNTSLYSIVPNPCQSSPCPPPFAFVPSGNAVRLIVPLSSSPLSTAITCASDTSATTLTGLGFQDPSGAAHFLPASLKVSTDSNCGPAQVSGFATDQSGFFVTFKNDGSVMAHDRSGNSYSISPTLSGSGVVTDHNGNQISQGTAGGSFPIPTTDTLGLTALSYNVTLSPYPALEITSETYTYSAPNGNSATVTLNYTTYQQQATSFGCPNVQEYFANGSSLANTTNPPGITLPTSLVLPDGSQYTFQYEGSQSSTTGRLAAITLPTGATVSYSYPGANGGINCADGTVLHLRKTTTDGTWSYDRVVAANNVSQTTTITDPQNNQTVVTFEPLTNSQNPPASSATPTNWIETQRIIYQGSAASGTALQTIATCYNGNISNCNSAVTAPVTKVGHIVILPTGLQKEQDTFINGTTGLPSEIDESFWQSPSAPNPARKTVIAYAALGNNILDRPASQTIYDGSGNQVSQTTFGYDESGVTATSGLPQHVGISGSRGNLTSVHRWLNTTGGTINTANTYDDAGQLLSTTDPAGHVTSLGYGCSDAFLATTTLPATAVSHTASSNYDCNTSLVISSTDQNNQISTFAYDNLYRPTTTNFPDGGQTTVTYFNPNEALTQSKMNGSQSISSYVLLDGYGRVSRTARTSGESAGYDQQDFSYSANGLPSFTSYPYQSTGFDVAKVTSGAGDSFAYDALGRTITVTHSDGSVQQTSYVGRSVQVSDEGNGATNVSHAYKIDGLGHLTIACEVSSTTLVGNGGASAPCSGLDVSPTGFQTNYTYDVLGNLTSVSQGGLNARTYTYDSLSRMTSETTPEAGTVTYNYGGNGLLQSRVRPAANQTNPAVTTTTTYSYDALNRLTSRVYNDGITPSANFVYDQNVGWGNPSTNLTNYIGRMTEAYIQTPSGTPCVGGIVFGYDVMGRVILNNQSTPQTCGKGNWPVSYQYDFAGNITTASNGVGVNFNYSYNIAGRLTQMSSTMQDNNHPGLLFSNAHYSPTSFSDLLGNGVVENASFSPRGFLQSAQTLLPQSGQSATASVQISGTLGMASGGSIVSARTQTPFSMDSPGNFYYIDSNGHVRQIALQTNETYTNWADADVTVSGIAAAGGSQLLSYVDSSGRTFVFYTGSNQHLILLEYNNGWIWQDMTTSFGNVLAASQAQFSMDSPGNFYYLDNNGHVRQVTIFSNGTFASYTNADVTVSGVAAAGGSQLFSYIDSSGRTYVFYTGSNQHLILLEYNNGWISKDMTASFGNVLASTQPQFSSDWPGNIFYLDSNGHVRQVTILSNGTFASYSNADVTLSAVAAAAGSQLLSYIDSSGRTYVFYTGSNQHLILLEYNNGWTSRDMTTSYGNVLAATQAQFSMNSPGNFYYLDNNGHVRQVSILSDGTFAGWTNADITGIAGAPVTAAGSQLLAYLDSAGQTHVFSVNPGQHLETLWYDGNWNAGDLSTLLSSADDSGIASLTVGGFTASSCYGRSSNPSCSGQPSALTSLDLAAFLTAALNSSSSPATASVSGATITLTLKQGGPSTISVSPLSTTHDNPNLFSNASFTSTAANFTGGSSGAAGYSFALGRAPDGQITSANDAINGNWSFNYDSFNRLASSSKNSGQTAFTYGYDRYGNRLQQNLTAGQGTSPQYTFDNNNHIVGSGVVYDALGNVINDSFHTYTYDAENRLVQVDGGSTAKYVYDALGRRVEGPNGDYLYDLAGHAETIIGLNGVWNYGEIYGGGRHLATYSGATTNFFHPDWLGTKRVMTGVNGAVSETCIGFAFGDGVNCTGTNWSFNSFTDDIHDSETNLEHTLFRQYSSTQGRWLTPDPAGTASADPTDPQSWNRYAYVLNDPVNATDSTGLDDDGFGLCSNGCTNDPFTGSFLPCFIGCNSALNLPVGALGILPGENGGLPSGLAVPGPIQSLLASLFGGSRSCDPGPCVDPVLQGMGFEQGQGKTALQACGDDVQCLLGLQYGDSEYSSICFLAAAFGNPGCYSDERPETTVYSYVTAPNPDNDAGIDQLGNTARGLTDPRTPVCFYAASATFGALGVEGGMGALADTVIPAAEEDAAFGEVLLRNAGKKILEKGAKALSVACGFNAVENYLP